MFNRLATSQKIAGKEEILRNAQYSLLFEDQQCLTSEVLHTVQTENILLDMQILNA